MQSLVHPEQDRGDDDRDGLDDRPEYPPIGIRVVEVMAERRELTVVERTGIDLIPECARRYGHGDRHVRARRRATVARPADCDGPGERGLTLVQRERRKKEVLRFHAGPLERSLEQRALAHLDLSKIGALGLR